MSGVSVIGLGPMGFALASALLDGGFAVTVWNRTALRAEPLVARGAVLAASPADAVVASDVTLINVVDNSVIADIVIAAGDSVAGRDVVGLASDTPDSVRRIDELVRSLGGRYLAGAIMTPTTTIGTGDASILFAGPRRILDDHATVLDVLATPTYLGENVATGAAYDMGLLSLFWTAVGGFVHSVSLARAHGVPVPDFIAHAQGIVGILPSIFDELSERIDADRHTDASAPVSSTAASLKHLIAASDGAGLDSGLLETVARWVHASVARGEGAHEISAIVASVPVRGR